MSNLISPSLKQSFDTFCEYIPASFKIAKKEDLISQLPADLICHIVNYVNERKTLDALSLTSRKFSNFTIHADYWENLHKKHNCDRIELKTLQDSAMELYAKGYYDIIFNFSRPLIGRLAETPNFYKCKSDSIEKYLQCPLKTAYESGEQIMSDFDSKPHEKLFSFPVDNEEKKELRLNLLKEIAAKLIKLKKPDDARKLMYKFYAERQIASDLLGMTIDLDEMDIIEEILTELHCNQKTDDKVNKIYQDARESREFQNRCFESIRNLFSATNRLYMLKLF